MAASRIATSYRQERRLLRSRWMWLWAAALLAFLAYLPDVLATSSVFGIPLTPAEHLGIGLPNLNIMLIVMIGAIALTVLTGSAGLVSFGNAAFFAVGALAASVTGVQWQWPFPAVLLVSGLFGAVVGAVVGLPSLRVRGFYLLLATLALQYVVGYVFLSYQDKYFGLAGVTFLSPSFFGWTLSDDPRWYLFLTALTAVVLLLSFNVGRTRAGRAFVAIRDNDVAAASVGVDVARVKLKAFAFSSFFISLAGALYVYYLGNASQDTFDLSLALSFVAMILIGGLGSLLGAVLGTLVWQLLPQVITTYASSGSQSSSSFLSTNAAQLSELILGVIVIALLLLRPDGLKGIWDAFIQSLRRWPYGS